MKKFTPAIWAATAVMLLGGCAYDAGYSRNGYGRSSNYGAVSPGSGYYDGYYGPYNGGYWAGDGAFYDSDGGSNYRRDDGSQFRRDSARGYDRF
jgi:hypothetical protein